ncbi:hypothetical protein PAMA_015594 [Pampus argenteus]
MEVSKDIEDSSVRNKEGRLPNQPHQKIRGLEDTMHELMKMQQLQTASVRQKRRDMKIFGGTSAERKTSFQTHSQDRHRVLQSVAFGRRAS